MSFVDFLYKSPVGRFTLKAMFKLHLLKLGERFVRSGLSKPLVSSYIKRNNIDMSEFEGQTFRTFQDFFSRKKASYTVDTEPSHLISPCDGLLSVFPIRHDTFYPIKGSEYRLTDLINDDDVAQMFVDGTCIILRLQANDYHHYCYFDDGYQYINHFIPGELHSVQPIACASVPVYRLNRRLWTLMDTHHFGKVVQTEVGALLVGGIENEKVSGNFVRGEEMGHFELTGSTIVLFFQKDQIRIQENILQGLQTMDEFPVKLGQQIGTAY
ncbi:MAG: phosphatidylserine decarboxylase [Lachnospiraceae bacterium]|nr:phosphatidylserine decarboxylase [Lachnospiraceae bacterium]